MSQFERLGWALFLILAAVVGKYAGYREGYGIGHADATRDFIVVMRDRGLIGPEFHPEIK